jgi:hypothetical protein
VIIFADLKAMLDTFTPEQLAMPVRWWGNERGGVIDSISALSEAHVHLGEGYEPRSGYDPSNPEDAEVLADAIDELPKGTPILWVDEDDIDSRDNGPITDFEKPVPAEKE